MKRFLLFFLTLFIFLIFPTKSFAASNFSADYTVTYNVLQNTSTHVIIDGSLTNLTDDYYASSYKIQLGFKDITNLHATDEGGAINPIVINSTRGNSIELPFNSKITGLDKKLNFNLSFDTSEVAQAQGEVWEINIPGLSAVNDFKSFNVNVLVPSFLGKPAYIKPAVQAVVSGN